MKLAGSIADTFDFSENFCYNINVRIHYIYFLQFNKRFPNSRKLGVVIL